MAVEDTASFLTRVTLCLQDPKKADKAPSKLKATILVCSQNPGSNSCRLLRSSLWAWFLVVTAIEHQPDITTLFDRLSHSDIEISADRLDNLTLFDRLSHSDIEISADRLDNLTVHESLYQLFEHTFYKSQRARDRQNSLAAAGFESSIPSHIRLSKRPRLDELEQPEQRSSRESPESDSPQMRLVSQCPNAALDAASSSCEETMQHRLDAPPAVAPSETYGITQSTNGNRQRPRWPKASVLPLVFPQRMCDGVEKDDIFARIAVSYTQNPAQCSLDIDVTRDMVSILANELFSKRTRYDGENARWVLELADGTDVSVWGELKLERAQESAIEPLLGTLVSTTLQNNPLRRRELARAMLIRPIGSG
ncbi:hypothetical protein BGZ61DRAFT_537724 [Ilyonectria robusta]|uniref:uncharacterized protein n=1 Tax=Ilyonectria robusta TaxID=1079257 RepID=UPI001E8EC694|nr:uncharacterized protein BGZ61DRAFT_537724 [Ilyonectria robusta]KAH8669288.1 hypothetical protein BGZ61DRAFT_537724 [Ilyonectria robusta]